MGDRVTDSALCDSFFDSIQRSATRYSVPFLLRRRCRSSRLASMRPKATRLVLPRVEPTVCLRRW